MNFSFWIIRGLLQCEMKNTVKGILENFVHLIRQFGLIPNGGRVYYLNRSQPPMFIQMVKAYEEFTGDTEFVKSILPEMLKEFEYWQAQHSISLKYNGQHYDMMRYNCEDDGPRPESYVEDFELVKKYSKGKTENEKRSLFWELKTGAETGWDYSSRWFINGDTGTNQGDLQDIKVRSIIPVELNCLHATNAKILAYYYVALLKDNVESDRLNRIGDDLTLAINEVLWNESDGVWYDYDLKNNKSR